MQTADRKHKVVMLGDFAVGKTSLVRRFVYDVFDDIYLSTIGVKVAKKDLALDMKGTTITTSLLLWDMGGEDRFSSVAPSYVQGARGAIITGDLTRIDSLDHMEHHLRFYRDANPGGIVALALNKADLCRPGEIPGPARERVNALLAAEPGALLYTSAKTGDNVEGLFLSIARRMEEQDS
jgi:small GTP-binding protein